MIWDVIVIGAGPSGMMAAYSARESGAQVLLLEKNRILGKKLRITGKGRCNITNNSTPREVMEQINGENRFLYRALNAFSPSDVITFFEAHGLPLKTERGRRVFPVSDHAADVAELLKNLCLDTGVSIQQHKAESIKAEDHCITGICTDEKLLPCRCCIVCTGGLSYPLTGSTGDGYAFAESVGHLLSRLPVTIHAALSCRGCRFVMLSCLFMRMIALFSKNAGRCFLRTMVSQGRSCSRHQPDYPE